MADVTDAVKVEKFPDWTRVREAIHTITSTGRFEPSTVVNALDVVSACEPRTKLPSGVKKGYWPTVVLWWEGFELEVFGDRVEVYRFRSEAGTAIWYEEHEPGGHFTPQFLGELAGLAG
jgi:hypothetical protein